MKGRRKNPRFSVDLKGFYFYKNEWIECKIYDLNLEGAGLNAGNNFEVNENIKIKFDTDILPINNPEDNSIKAVVVNKFGTRIGIKFINIKKQDKDYLSKIINNFSNRYIIE